MIVSSDFCSLRCRRVRPAGRAVLAVVAAALALLAVFAVGGCGGGGRFTPAPTPVSPSNPAPTPPGPDPTPAPAPDPVPPPPPAPPRFTMYAIGETAYSKRFLIRFNSDAPENISVVGPFPDYFASPLDFRPSDGLLYAGSTRISTVDPNTAALTPRVVLTGTSLGGDSGLYDAVVPVDADFDPVGDRLRIAGAVILRRGLNNYFTVSADVSTGQAQESSPVVYAPGDVNQDAVIAAVDDLAYSNKVAGATSTTLYGIDTARDVLVQVDSDGRTLRTVGPLGVDATVTGSFAEGHGFDIVTVNGENIAYAVLRAAGAKTLYAIDLATGRATRVGPVGPVSETSGVLRYWAGLAIAPVPAGGGASTAGARSRVAGRSRPAQTPTPR